MCTFVFGIDLAAKICSTRNRLGCSDTTANTEPSGDACLISFLSLVSKQQILLFLKKKKQKDFCSWCCFHGRASWSGGLICGNALFSGPQALEKLKSFWFFFFRKRT
jgi:hypothetical protein